MADDKPLSDNGAHDRLYKAIEVLGQAAPGSTVHADTALQAARQGLRRLALALLHASIKGERD
jgi:flavin-binding protein dodecin